MPQSNSKNVIRVGILVGLIAIRFVLGFRNTTLVNLLVQNGILILGLIIGFALTELDHWLYALMCNPQELACMRVKGEIQAGRWRSAWTMLQQTKAERTKLPVHNAITGLIVAIMGVWLVTSLGNLLAEGLVFGLSLNLLSDFWWDADHTKWYWIIARPITATEDQIVKWVWTGLVVIMLLFMI